MNSKLITTFKEYETLYNTRLEYHLSLYVDYDELHFIKSELDYFDNCFKNSNVTLQAKKKIIGDYYDGNHETYYEYEVENYEFLDIFINNDIQKLITIGLDFDDLGDSSDTNFFDLEICKRLKLSFSKIISFLNHKISELTNPTIQPIQNKVKFHGDQIQFIELIKSLIENGNLKGTQKDIIENCSNFFDIRINNPDQTLSKIKNDRNNGSETLFLDQLKKTYFDYIRAEKIK